MKVLVSGGRKYSNINRLFEYLDELDEEIVISEIIQGGATGADSLAKRWADAKGIPTQTFMADWARYGNGAGNIRNQEMLDVAKPDLVVAFPGNEGTKDMVTRSRFEDVEVKIVDDWL